MQVCEPGVMEKEVGEEEKGVGWGEDWEGSFSRAFTERGSNACNAHCVVVFCVCVCVCEDSDG